MFSRIEPRKFLALALASAVIVSAGACENSDDVASPVESETRIQAAGLGLPTAELMVASTNANDGQESDLRQARQRWESADSDTDSHPMQGFLLEASTFLDHDQMVSLVNLVAETREARGEQAQRRGGARQGMRGRGQMNGPREGILEYADELGLSEDQVAQLTTLREEFRAQVQEVRGERQRGQRPTEEQRAQMDELREAHQAKVQGILTEEQWAQLGELRTQKREERQEQRQARGDARQEQRLEFLVEFLDLSEEQREAIETVLAEQHEKMVELREEFHSGLEAGERPSKEAREAHREAMDAIREEVRAAIVELLDEDQADLFEALEELHSQSGRRGRR